MSLFGTSPDDALTGNNPKPDQLFADEPGYAGKTGSSLLFADDLATADDDDNNINSKHSHEAGSSPWSGSVHRGRRAGRHELVKTLLPAKDVPDAYADAYDLLLDSGDGAASQGIGLAAVQQMLAGSGLSAPDQEKIVDLVMPSDRDSAIELDRARFNVLFALIGLAQEGEELSLDAVDDRRKSMYWIEGTEDECSPLWL